MARKTNSYQKGSVIEVKNRSGTVFRLRYRKRNLEGGWIEITETLRECPNRKTAPKELAKRLEPINASNGGSVQKVEKRFSDLFTSLWPNYLDKEQVKPSTRASYQSAVDKWINPFFGRVLLEGIDAFMVGDFMAKLGSARLSAKYRKNIYNLLRLLLRLQSSTISWRQVASVRRCIGQKSTARKNLFFPSTRRRRFSKLQTRSTGRQWQRWQ
jgi:Phage integrase, N-terminal SAM-like domain